MDLGCARRSSSLSRHFNMRFNVQRTQNRFCEHLYQSTTNQHTQTITVLLVSTCVLPTCIAASSDLQFGPSSAHTNTHRHDQLLLTSPYCHGAGSANQLLEQHHPSLNNDFRRSCAFNSTNPPSHTQQNQKKKIRSSTHPRKSSFGT